MLMFSMAPLPHVEREDTELRIAKAFLRACGIDDVLQKEAEDFLLLDHGQLQRQLTAKERTQLIERAANAAARKKREAFFGNFVACLLDEFGGWTEVLGHGLGRFVAALVMAPGQARMARASLDTPRSREERECGSGSLRVSA